MKLCSRKLILNQAQENEINSRSFVTSMWEEYRYLSINTRSRLVVGITHDLASKNDLKIGSRDSKLELQVIEF